MVNVKAINDERLGRWKVQMIRRHSTPLILLGIGHDKNLGELTVLCTEDRTDEQLVAFLEAALAQLKENMADKN